MSNDFFNASGTPAQASAVVSPTIRSEFTAVGAGFDKLPVLTGNAYKIARVNASGSAMESVAGDVLVGDVIHAATNKTPPVDADEFGIWDSVSGLLRHLTWANVKAIWSASGGAALIGFIQAGTGAVVTTAQAKLRESVSLEDKGGSPSASAATNDAALAAAFADFNTVILQTEGTWTFNTALVLLGKTLKGKSKTATILHYTGNGIAITVGGSDSNAPGLIDFTLTGTASATGGILESYAANGCRRGKFDNVLVTGFTGAGVFGWDLVGSLNNGVYYNTHINCGAESNTKNWRCYSSDGAANGNRANSNTWINCTGMGATGGDGWFFDYAVGNTLIGCDRETNSGFGIQADHTLDLTIIGGYSEGNTSGWLKKTASSTIRAFGGRIVDTTTVGTAVNGDLFMAAVSGLSIAADGGLGMGGATPVANGINAVNTSDFAMQLSGTNFLALDHTNTLVYQYRSFRKVAVVKSSSAGALSFAGVTNPVVEVTLTENVTAITMPTAVDGVELDIIFKQGAGPYTVAGWPSGSGGVLFAAGAFTVTATNGKFDTVKLRYNTDFARWMEVTRTQNLS